MSFHAYIAVVLISLQLIQSAVVLRIRLPNGSMQRFEIDDESETISGLREKLRGLGMISSEDVSFTLKDRTYSAIGTSSVSEGSESAGELETIGTLSIKSGDILSIIRPAAAKEAKENSSKEPSLTSEMDANGIPIPVKVPKKVVQKKKPTSIADLEKTRKELLKVTRQKTSGGRSVSMTSNAGRILNRIAETGGYALLMGKTIKSTPVKGAAKKGTSIAAIAKLENAVKEKVEVHAVCEIYQYTEHSSEHSPEHSSESSLNVLPDNLSDLPSVAAFLQIAESLGLSIVGCCVGMPKHLQGERNCF